MGNLSSTTSSTTTHRKKYEVFLSFRGEDTRDGFTSHLFDALHRKQIETFIDNRLRRGDEISHALLRAIGESKIAVVIFSKDYTSSKWCLRELAEIMKYKKLNKQIVIPVFYNIDPSDVRKQIGSFKDSFAKHENELQKEVQKWREALTEASSISGWDSSVLRPESTFVVEIVKDIWKKLNNMPASSDFQGLIGIDKHIERVISLLCLGVSDFQVVGIWGMGGIGKTTVADAVFQLISYQFENSYFVSCVRETSEKNGELIRLRDEILSKVLNEENLKVSSPSIPQSIKSRLNHKKILIVLDDVDNFRKLEMLVGGLDRFGPGSRIILTTRDKQVLLNSDLDDRNIYKIDELNHDEALQLFRNNAFKQNRPIEDLIELSKEIVNYAKGCPLALKVLGSSFYRKSKREWESAVEKLQRIFNPEILDVLKISYDGLDDDEKDLFLDIACFYLERQSDNLPNLLSSREFSLRNLGDKSLVTIDQLHFVTMHDLLRKMGREIVRQESPNKPNNRSRLWRQEDVLRMLKNDEGTDALQGIFLTKIKKDVHLSSRVFEKMYNLKTLLIKCQGDFCKVPLPNGLDYLPDELRYLHWDWYPLEELPSSFNPVNLVELDLAKSNIKQLWDGRKCLPKLMRLNLSYCKHLIRIPDLSDIPLAEYIQLEDCISLLEIHSSTQCLKNLELMDCKNLTSFYLPGCISLTKFPQISGSITSLILRGSGVEEVPSEIQSLSKLEWLDMGECRRLKSISTSICKLKSLYRLDLWGCYKLESFPKILERMELKRLCLNGTAIKELPPSIENLNRLQDLYLVDCKNLEMLPSSISNLGYLNRLLLYGCSKLEKLPPLSGLSSLTELNLNNCNLREIPEDIGCLSSLEKLKLSGNGFESLPKSIKELSELIFLTLNNCGMLRSLTELPSGLSFLAAMDCKQLIQFLPDESEFELYSDGRGSLNLNFMNCLKLDQKAVSNVFRESLLKMQLMMTEKVSPSLPYCSVEAPDERVKVKEVEVGICLPGSEIPEWFRYKNLGSSINIPALGRRHDCGSNRYIMGFAVCTVIGFEENSVDFYQDGLHVSYDFHIEDSDGHKEGFFQNPITLYYGPAVQHEGSIGSDHIFLGYNFPLKCYEFFQKLDTLLANRSMGDYVGASFEFHLKHRLGIPVKCIKVKHCGIHPMYVQLMNSIAINQDTEETCEPRPKRICTHENRCS